MKKIILILIVVLIAILTGANTLMADDAIIQGFDAVFNFGTFETHFGLGECNSHKEYESSNELYSDEWCPVANAVIGLSFRPNQDRRGLEFFTGLGYLGATYFPPVYPDGESVSAHVLYLDAGLSSWGWDIEVFVPVNGSDDFHSQVLFGGGIAYHIALPFGRRNADFLLGANWYSFELRDIPVTYTTIVFGIAKRY